MFWNSECSGILDEPGILMILNFGCSGILNVLEF